MRFSSLAIAVVGGGTDVFQAGFFGAKEGAGYQSLTVAAAHFGDAADYPFGVLGHIQFFKFLVAVAAIITGADLWFLRSIPGCNCAGRRWSYSSLP